MDAIRPFVMRLAAALVLYSFGATSAQAQAPEVTIRNTSGGLISNGQVYTDPSQMVVFQICSPYQISSMIANHWWPSGSTNLFLEDGPYDDCSNGGQAWLAQVSLAPGTNYFEIDVTDEYFQNTYTSVMVQYVVPSATIVRSGAPGGLRVPPMLVQKVPFTVTNTGSQTRSFITTVGCTGSIVSQCKHVRTGTATDTTNTLGTGQSYVVEVMFTAGTSAGTGSISLTTNADSPGAESVGLSIARGGMPVPELTRARDTVFVAPNTARTAQFALRNPDPFASRVITLAVPNCGGVTGCSPSPSSITLGAGRDTTVTVSFNVPSSPSTQTTSLLLTASASSPTQVDSETVVVKVHSAGTPTTTVKVAGLNPGTSVSRDQCLSIAAGAAAGVECGALRVAHGLPGLRTMGVARAPTLLFLSDHGQPRVRVVANVSVARLWTVPDSVRVKFAVSGLPDRTLSWPWQPECGSAAGCIINFPVATDGYLATGVHNYTLEVTVIGASAPAPASTTGSVVVVDNRTSYFGQGWWLEGHERLLSTGDATTRLWIGGDGSTRIYKERSPTVWTVDSLVTRPDTLLRSGGEWHRQLRNGSRVTFDSLLRHVRTTNRQGHVTTFHYRNATSTRLDSISLPKPSGSSAQASYRFQFLGDSSRIERIFSPGHVSGTVDTTRFVYSANGHLTHVIEPANGAEKDTVRFLYGAPTSTAVLIGRVNRLNDTTQYVLNAHGTVDSVKVKMDAAAPIVTTFCVAETRSLVACGVEGARPLPVTRYHTRYDGPRTDVSDVTRFFITRFGAPDVIVDALGGRTVLKRTNATFPGLVTETVDPAGLVSQSFYNARGLPDSARTLDPLGTGANAVSKFYWHSKWDMATRMISPTGEVDSVGVDNSTGNRLWQRRVGGERVTFAYDGYNRVDSVFTPGTTLVASFVYGSSLGNVWKSKGAKGYLTEAIQNARGLDTLIWTPTDTLQTAAYRTKQVVRYDRAGRPVRTEVVAPRIPWTLQPIAPETDSTEAGTQVVVTEYDKEGRTLSVRRFAAADSSAGATAKSIMTYDPAGRTTSKSEWHTGGNSVLTYDPAGNVVSTQTGRGKVIKQSFDALNRVFAQSIPEVSYGRVFCSECHSWTQFIVGNDSVFAPDYGSEVAPNVWTKAQTYPAQMVVFGYDTAGRMVQADNPEVRIRRGYFRNGALKADTTNMRAYHLSGTQWPTANRSILTYTYDLSGRRLSRADQRGGLQTYGYNALGLLDSTSDRATSGGTPITVEFGYDALGRLTSQSIPVSGGTVSSSWSYDAEGQVTGRTDAGFSDSFKYDARGKRIEVTGKLLMTGTAGGFYGVYDGFGHLVASATDDRPVPTSERIQSDAHGNAKARWSNRGEWGGNTESLDSASFQGHVLVGRLGSHFPGGRQGPGGVGPALDVVDSLGITYDNSGNVESQINIRRRYVDAYPVPYTIRGNIGHSWTWNFYDASERLRAAQRSAPSDTAGKISTIFEEYWYDALGRRVLVRTRVDSATACPSSEVVDPVRCQQQVLRTTWDGDQVLFEQRDPGGRQFPVMDAGGRVPIANGDAWYGHIRYTQTGAIDNPLLVWKNDVTVRTLHRNWRGNVAGATIVSTGAADTITVWPAAISDVWLAPDASQSLPTPNAWLGSLVADGKDGTGTLYRRNRYYDPVTGRFTQPDPIGLAGGMNLYGYAGGDPINFSDPFGLCPKSAGGSGNSEDLADCPRGTSGWWAMQDSKGAYQWTRNWVRGSLAACSESTLCAGIAGGGAAVLGGLAISSAAAIIAGGTGTAAVATGAVAIPEGEVALAVVHQGRVIAWTSDLALSHAAWVARLGGIPTGATVVTVGKLAGELMATYSKTIHGNQSVVSQAIMAALRSTFR